MSTRQLVNRRAISLAECMVAVAIVGGLGVSMMTLVSGGAQVGARAGETTMASLVGARVVDRMTAIGFMGLERKLKKSGPEGELDLGTLDPKWKGRDGKGKGPWGRKGQDGENPLAGLTGLAQNSPAEPGPQAEPGAQAEPGPPAPGPDSAPGQAPAANAPAAPPLGAAPFQTRSNESYQRIPEGDGANPTGAPGGNSEPGDRGDRGEREGEREGDRGGDRGEREGDRGGDRGEREGDRGDRGDRGGDRGEDGDRRGRGERKRDHDKLAPETVESKTLTVDGFVYKGRYALTVLEPGLMKVTVKLAWDRYGVNVPKSPGQMELVRYVADPLIALGGK